LCANARGGAILREVYTNISGASVASLTNNASYPNSPSSTNWITDLFEVPVDVGDNYGQRIRGYILPPQSGLYTFWIASDDQSELWLSTNAWPATNYLRIATLTDWSNPREWTKYSSQQSAPIFLQAGSMYAIYALMKEGGGGDNLAVRWRLPDGTMEEPIPATRLLPPGGPFVPPQLIGQSDTNVAATENGTAEFWVATSNLYPLSYQWQQNSTNIAGASASNLVLNPVLLSDSGSVFRCVISNSLGVVTSAPCLLTVSADTNAPEIAGAYNVGTTLVYVVFTEPVETNSALTMANYTVSGGISVLGASFGVDEKTIALQVSPVAYGATYTVTASNVADRAASANIIAAGAQWMFTVRSFASASIGAAPDALLSYTTNGVDITAAGAGFGGSYDEGTLNYLLKTGDFDVQVRLHDMSIADVWAKAGIMARATLADDSDFAAVFATPTIGGAFFEYRNSSPNLLANPGFESGRGPSLNPTNWNGDWYTAHALTNNTLLPGSHRAPAAARTGTWMLMLTNNATVTGDNWHGTGQFFPCTPTGVYIFTSYVMIQSNLPAQHSTLLKIEWYDAATNRLYTDEAEGSRLTNKVASWTFSWAVAIAPAGAALGKAVYLYEDLDGRTNNAAERYLVYWDDATVWQYSVGETVHGSSLPVNDPDTWLRLKRAGNIFTGFLSYDAQRWTQLGTISNALPGTVYLGMAVSSHGDAPAVTARFRDWGDASGGTTGRQVSAGVEPPGPSSRRTGIAITEINYHPPTRIDGRDGEFIELFNTEPYDIELTGWRIAGDVAYLFPSGTVLRAGTLLVVASDPADVQTIYGITGVLGGYSGQLSNGSGLIQLRNDRGGVVLEVEYGDHAPWPASPDGDGPTLALAKPSYGEDDARAWAPSVAIGGSPGHLEPVAASPYGSVVINEVLAHTDLPQLDFVELYNHGSQSVDISGFTILVKTNEYVIPASTVLPPRGFAYFAETQMGFVIDMEGSRVGLRDAQDERLVDFVSFGATSNGVSLGRYPDGAPSFHELAAATAGTNNAALLIRDVVINEIMFHPISNDDNDEYIELHNRTAAPVNVGNWRISDGITYVIPANTVIPAGGYLVVARSVTNLIAKYPQLNATNTAGNFSGKLSDHGERIVLEMPEDAALPGVNYVLMDEVTYVDGWGQWTDGDGSSLELVDARSDNRLENNWAGSDESAKGAWTTLSVTGFLEQGMGSVDEVHFLMQGDGECLVDDVVALRTVVNRVTNGTFNANLNGWLVQGDHMRSGWDATNGVGGTGCLHVRASGSGDTGANRIETTLSSPFTTGETNVLQVTARWLAGDPDFLMRYRGNWMELPGTLPVPSNLGTPGQANSRAVANAGPAVAELSHSPAIPAANEDVVVSARVADPDGIASVTLGYRVDPSATTNTVVMLDNGTAGDAVAGDGVYSATIPGLATGSVIAFRVRAMDGAGSPATNVFPNPESDAECVVQFGDNEPAGVVGSYRMWLTAASIASWTNAPNLSNEFWPGTFVNGTRIIYNAGIHYRGSAFLRPIYDTPTGAPAAYRIDLPKAERFLGVDELNMDTLEPWRDNTRQRERTIYWMAAQLGLPSSHQRSVALYLNGVRRGDVYADVFHVEGAYVESWFPDNAAGDIFKIDDWIEFTNSAFAFTYNVDQVNARLAVFTNSAGGYNKGRYRWNFEKKSNGGLNDDYARIFELAGAMSDTNPATYFQRVSALIDVDSWAKVFALRHVVCDWDGYGYARGKNCYLYKPSGEPWKMLLWDLDFGLGTPDSHPVDTSLFHEIEDPAVSNRFLGTPAFRRAFLQAVKALVDGPMLFANVNPVVDEYYASLQLSGVAAYPPDDMKTWIGLRRNHVLSQLLALDAPFVISNNGGADFSTNVNFITLSGTGPLSVRAIKVNGVLYAPTWTSVSNWSFVVTLAAGANSLDVRGVDEHGVEIGGAVDSINVNFSGSNALPAGSVVINEIMYNPSAAGAEFIEIHNRSSTHAFDLFDYKVDGAGLTITNSVVMLPGAFVVLAEDPVTFASAYGGVAVAAYYSGSLDDGGERLQLIQLNGTNTDVLVDDVIYDDVAPWSTNADGAGPSLQLIDAAEDNNRVGNWTADGATPYTPGASNSVARDLPSFPLLWLNELLVTNTSGVVDNNGQREPWLELFNQATVDQSLTNFYLTDTYTNLAKWRFPGGSFAHSNGFRVLWLDNQTNQISGTNYHAAFRPSTTNGSIALVLSNGTNLIIVDYMNHPTIGTNLSYGDYPDGVWTNRASFANPTPGASNEVIVPVPILVRINEFLADNADSAPDAYGHHYDWVELYNAGTNGVNLEGFGLSDNLSQPLKWRFPAGISINAGGFLHIWTENNAPTGLIIGLYATNFSLSKSGEALSLAMPNGTVIDSFTFGPQATDISQGRWPDGSNGIVTLGYPTPDAPNVSTNNTVPTLNAIGNKSVDEMTLLTFVVSATDTDTPPQTLTFTLEPGAPTNAAIGALSGVFTWTPGEEQGPATNVIAIRVTDNGYLNRTIAETITVAVAEVNQAPVLQALGPFTVQPGSRFSYQIVAEDPDIPANAMSYSTFPFPGMVDTNGWFHWTPSNADALTTNVTVITVLDDGSPPLADTNGLVIVVSSAGQYFEATAVPVSTGTGLVVRWSAETGELYRVFYADGLLGPIWTELPGDVTATDVVAQKLDTVTNTLGQRYYRVIRLLP